MTPNALTIDCAAAAAAELLGAFEGPQKVVLDLSRCERLDSSGLQILVAAVKEADASEREFEMTGVLTEGFRKALKNGGIFRQVPQDGETLGIFLRRTMEVF